ncbi:hypothetical protein MAP00_007895 [Monascus purpureus]|nr:hypothetical protein MAP00_007895 [Monascus purpureus]
MPSILEDPTTKIPPPKPTAAPTDLKPRKATLKTGQRVTFYPVIDGSQGIPAPLVEFLSAEFSAELERGCTYPIEEMSLNTFRGYWFGMFAVVVVLDDDDEALHGLREGRNWEEVCLGTFYIKPNYPGRCSHVCNGGFLTTKTARGKGVGNVMGEAYLDFAPKLGYKYSVFNLVFANNMASIRIWERLGFSIIGRVPGAAKLENSEELVDALIIGRELGEKSE